MSDCRATYDRNLRLAVISIVVVVLLSLGPLILEPLWHARPLQLDFFPPYAAAWLAWSTKAAVTLAMALCVWLYWRNHRGLTWRHMAFCLAVAAGMTAMHWFQVDRNPKALAWQTMVYTAVLNHQDVAPHNLRPLPYGFVRLLEGITGDWTFSCVAYRCFFSLWFVCAAYQFARLWISPRMSYIVVAILGVLYHYSIKTYLGQLTDPMSHWLFVLALTWAVEDRWLPLAVALAAGVLAKETAMLIVPGYCVCTWRRRKGDSPIFSGARYASEYPKFAAKIGTVPGWPALGRTAALGVVCLAAFLSVRLPYGWGLHYQKINGTPRSMLWLNLQVLDVSYRHLVRFFLIFIPFIVYGWRSLDGRLKALCLTVVPLVLASNFWFGWIHESRNYMPLVPILAAAALNILRPAAGSALAGGGKFLARATPQSTSLGPPVFAAGQISDLPGPRQVGNLPHITSDDWYGNHHENYSVR